MKRGSITFPDRKDLLVQLSTIESKKTRTKADRRNKDQILRKLCLQEVEIDIDEEYPDLLN